MMSKSTILRSLYVSVVKSMMGRYAVYAIQLISLLILARLFSPEQFGIVASVQVFFVFFQLISEIGIGPALINLKKLSPADRNGIFSLTLLLGGGLAMIFGACGLAIESFYKINRVSEVVPYVAASILFSAASIVPTASLLREQKFFKLAHAGLIAELGSVAGVVILVRYVDPLHALASKAISSAILQFLACYWFSKSSEFGLAKPGRQLSAIKPLLSFSLYQFGFNFINYFSRNLDSILVGRRMGADALGVYSKAYQLMRYPLMLLTSAMTPAIQPVINKYAGDKIMVEALHRDFAFKLAMLGVLAGAGMFFLSDLIVALLLGPQWKAVSPVIHVLSLAVPVQVVLSTSGSFFQAMNRTDLLFRTGSMSAIIMVSAISYGVYCADLLVLSWALVVAFHLCFLLAYYMLYSKVFEIKVQFFLKKMIFPFVVVVLMMLSFIFDLGQLKISSLI